MTTTLELGVVPVLESPHYLYQVQLEGNRRVYMRACRTPYMNERRVVVIVDAQRFVRFWRGDERASAAHAGKSPISAAFGKLARRATALLQTREQEQLDAGHRAWLAKERSDIAMHFAQGIYNPVALADVSCFQDAAGYWHLNFIDGITPTEYLLANGATSFPVLCGVNEGAAKLHALTGVAGFLPRTVEDLAPLEICNLDYVIRNGFFDPKTHELDRFRLVRERWGGEAWWENDITASRALCPYH